MTIEYDAIKDKEASTMTEALKKMCTVVQTRQETNTDGRSRKMVREKYLCPCGIIDVVNSKMENPDAHAMYVASDKCGI